MTDNMNASDALISEVVPLIYDDVIETVEVPEGRLIEGANLTLRADVYGELISHGGTILLNGNLSGGSAINHDGNITSKGRAFNALIEAGSGQIKLNYAESCLILGDRVVIEHAVNCDIVARNVQVVSAEGCSIAGETIQIKSSGTCRSKDTLISILLPDLAAADPQMEQLRAEINEGRQLINAKEQEIALLKADVEFAKYLLLAKQIRQRTTLLNPAQQESWEKMTERFADCMQTGSRLSAEKKLQLTRVEGFVQELAQLQQVQQQKNAAFRCSIAKVAGDTSVRSIVMPEGVVTLQKDDPALIRIRLREQDINYTRLFSSDSGSLAWHFKAAIDLS